MAQTYTDTNVNSLTINMLNKTEYDNLPQVSGTELYLVEEQVDSVVTQNSTNPVQSNAVYQALQNHHDVIMMYFAHNHAYTVSLTDAYYDTTDEELVEQDPATWTGRTPQLPIITAGYYYDLLTGKIYYIENEGDLPVEVTNVEIQGDMNKLYIDLNTSKAYRWNGSAFMLLAANATNCLKQVDLSTYQATDGEIVQNIGSNSSGYINGYVYKKSNVHSLTYNGVTYTHIGETNDNVTWKLYKITQDNIDYVVPQTVNIGDNFWVVRDFTNLEVVHIFEIDNIGENEGRTVMDIEGHFLGTNITLHFVAPFSEIINTSKALIYKNGNNYLYCDATFKFFASSVNNNNANVIPFDGTVNNAYVWQRINIQPNQLSVENNKVKYTLSDGITKLTLAQESDLKSVAFSGSYNDLTDKLQNATTSSAGLMSASDKTLINSLSITELTNIAVTWINNFSGTIRVFQYGKILQVYITTYSTQDVGINSRICYLNITPTYSTYYTCGILRSPTADPIGIFTSSQNSNLTFYLAQTYRTGNTYTGSMLIII